MTTPRTITLTRIHNAFDRRDRETVMYEYLGEPLAEFRKGLPSDVEFVLSVNGRVAADEELGLIIPQPGDMVVCMPVPAGGNTGKEIGRIIGMIVLTIAAALTYQYELMPAIFGLSAATTSMIAAGAIMIIGGVVVNTVFAPRSNVPAIGPNFNNSSAYSWSPATLQQQGIVIPRWYGTNQLTGNVINSWIDYDSFYDSSGSNQYINALVSLGMGPFANIPPLPVAGTNNLYTGILINGQPYNNYSEALQNNGQSYGTATAPVVHITPGLLQQALLPGFDVVKTEYACSVKVTKAAGPYTYLTQGNSFDGLEVVITFPQGLWLTNSSGSLIIQQVQFEVDIQLVGTDTWQSISQASDNPTYSNKIGWSAGYWVPINANAGVPGTQAWYEVAAGPASYENLDIFTGPIGPYHTEGAAYPGTSGAVWHWFDGTQSIAQVSGSLTTITVGGNQTSAMNFVCKSPLTLAHGQYNVRVTRLTADNISELVGDDMYLGAVNEVTNVGMTYPRQALVGIRALATNQLSGSFSFSVVADCQIVMVYDGTSWTAQFSSNPAWVLWDLLTQPVFDNNYNVVRYDGTDPSNLVLADFWTLAQWCDTLVSDGAGGQEKQITFNGGFDSEQTLWDACMQVCQVAWCMLIPRGRQYGLAIDMPATPTQLFSVGNVVLDSFQETYLAMEDRAATIEIDYIEQTQGWQRTEISVVNPELLTVANIVTLQVVGITKASQAWRYAYHQLAINQYLIRSIQFGADIDAIACQVGDVINFSHDVPQWGFGGRVVSATATTVQIDREVTLVEGEQYCLMVRLTNDTIVTSTVTNGPGATDILTVATPFTTVPDQYDIYAFGQSNIQTKPFRVTQITPSSTLAATITAAEYNAAIYSGLGNTPLNLTPVNYSALSPYVQILNLTLSEQVSVSEGGTLQRCIAVAWTIGDQVAYLRADVYLQQPGLPWQLAASSTGTTVVIQGVAPATVYNIMVVGVNSGGLATPYPQSPVASISTSSTSNGIASITTITITGLQVQGGGTVFNGRDCPLVWNAPAVAGVVDHYEVQIYNGTTLLRTDTSPTNAYTYTYGMNFDDTNGAPVPSFTVNVAAVDIGGALSAWASVTVSNSVPAPPTAVGITPLLFAIQLTITYASPEDFACCEIWAAVTDNSTAAALIGTTTTAAFLHSGLASVAVEYYWCRVKDLFGQESAWYPLSATQGVQGTTLTDPSSLLTLLNGNISQDSLASYLGGQLDLLPLLDTGNTVAEPGVAEPGVFTSWCESITDAGSNAYDANVQVQAATESITQLQGEIELMATATTVDGLQTSINTAQADINAINAAIELLATAQSVSNLGTTVTAVQENISAINATLELTASQGSVNALSTTITQVQESLSAANAAIDLCASQSSLDTTNSTVSSMSAELEVAAGQISLKLDNNGNVAGLIVGWGNAGTSEVIFLSNVFKVCQPSGSGPVDVFTVGNINGNPAVGISGSLIIDGSITANALAANQLVVGTNVAMGANATISWSAVQGAPTSLATLDSTAASTLSSAAETASSAASAAASAASAASSALQTAQAALPADSAILTYISPTGVYTGTLTAEQVNAIAANITNINATNIVTGSLSVTAQGSMAFSTEQYAESLTPGTPATINLGNVNAGDRILVSAVLNVEGGSSSTVSGQIYGGGTASITFCGPYSATNQIKTSTLPAATGINNECLTGVVFVTAAGTLTLNASLNYSGSPSVYSAYIYSVFFVKNS